MTLSALIRKRDTGNLATAIPAIPAIPAISATQPKEEAATVARIATVAVANPKEEKAAPCMTAEEEKAIRAWLALIEENAPAMIADVIEGCQRDADTRAYFLGRSAAELPKPDPFPDDRRTCNQCANLIARRCQAAKRGEIVASRNYEPIRDLPRRCEGYAPGQIDPDRRHGRERWPGLIRQGGE